ncbi:MAG TPA: hypothetical protein DDY14_07745 [Chromatiaceae bacterium]|nr:MAG: hypothetical protein N838_09425 [Thiohalocapsa sp. PB-PSB1]QQO54756.1 MAG: hypothetical protein N838_16830 [Thiohalocapsa sp. PB-PSB1]HBG95206.1 hypothetical protein [Chromatiaceae bacterium]
MDERSVQIIPATGKSAAFWMREIRCRSANGHQAGILTTRQDLPLEVIAERMFQRWRQENFFKYMQAEFNSDHSSTYATELADPQRSVPNPEPWLRRREKAFLACFAVQKAIKNRGCQHPVFGVSLHA